MRCDVKSYLVLLCCFVVCLTSCNNLPEEDYLNFKKRSESIRENRIQIVSGDSVQTETSSSNVPTSQVADIRGIWLVNARLSVGIPLGLKIQFSSEEEWPIENEKPVTPFVLQAKIWLDVNNTQTDPPLIEVDTLIGEDGTFTLEAKPLSLDPDAFGLTSAVDADVTLESQILSSESICGIALGNVTEPINVPLEGSVFYAVRDDQEVKSIEDLPSECPNTSLDAMKPTSEQKGEMMTEDTDEESMGGEEQDNDEPIKPAVPELGQVDSALGDLTGHWFINVKLAAAPIPLKLWISLVYVDSETGGLIDGSLRRADAELMSPPLAQFSTIVDEQGRFEIWLPDFQLTGSFPVEGNLLISGVTLPVEETTQRPQGWCGGASGTVNKPLMIDLEGTTLYAHPWKPGDGEPDPLLDQCP